MYLNSKLGPNTKKQICERTVHRYLTKINFSVKRTTFSPSNRNCICLRVFRVTLSKFIEQIINQKNILLGFIDEASESACEGNKYGRAYKGISPVIQSPLSKCIVSVIALVIPGFGVIYNFQDRSVYDDCFLSFIKRSITFLRKFICNKECEIVFIEDNCKIHQSEKVENEIINMNIAIISTVQYSPSLNGVAE